MFLNSILIFLGVMTILLGIFNLIAGSYIWGTIFILGGIWSIGIGIFYFIQDEKDKKKRKAQEALQREAEINTTHPIDEGLLTKDLFEVDELTRQMIDNGPTEEEIVMPSEQSLQEIDGIGDLENNSIIVPIETDAVIKDDLDLTTGSVDESDNQKQTDHDTSDIL